MSTNSHLFLGRAGQLYIVSEFLLHKWNAAIPEVDVGDDVFVVRDKIGEFKRVQVKTVTAIKRTYGYSAQYLIPNEQLTTPITPELVYFLIIRLKESWKNYIIIERSKLQEYVELNSVGKLDKRTNNIQLYISFNTKKGEVKCSKKDFKKHIKDWKIFR